jgi:hypothetical protein
MDIYKPMTRSIILTVKPYIFAVENMRLFR